MAWIYDNLFLIGFAFALIIAFWPMQARSYNRIRQKSGELSASAYFLMYVASMAIVAFVAEDYALSAIEGFGNSVRSTTTF